MRFSSRSALVFLAFAGCIVAGVAFADSNPSIDPGGALSPLSLPFSGTDDVGTSIAKIIAELSKYVAILATMAFTYGGIIMLLSYGDEGKIKNAKKILTYAAVGIVVSGAAYAIVDAVNSLTF